VENYARPIWTFNKLLYIEKEGFSEALKDNGWAERHDCALISSKGFSTRAARDLVDKLAEHDEPCTIFCATDADAFGTMIYQTFQEATKARGARKVRIIHLGLHPWEAVAEGLEVEEVQDSDKRKPVADYVLERADGEFWAEWLQTHRVELNAMTTPEFIAWLDRKLACEQKLIPPSAVLAQEFETQLAAEIRSTVIARILREANAERQISAALKKIRRPSGDVLAGGIRRMFERTPEKEWRDHIKSAAKHLRRTRYEP
jgi:hypothetical protein